MKTSWSAQVFRQAGEMPSGPDAFLCLRFPEDLTRPLHRSKVKEEGRGGGGLMEMLINVWSGRVWGAKHSSRL